MTASQSTPTTSPGTAEADRPVIAFLGTGRMGGPMAANLASAGFPVRAWNRTSSHTATATAQGAAVAATPAEAVEGAAVVITMLADGPATDQVLSGTDGFARTRPPGLIWAQMGTIGLEWTTRLARTAGENDIAYADAPVSGSQGPAEAGDLVILASGPDEARDALTPAFDVLGRDTFWLGPAGNGTRAKLVFNSWLADLTEATAENLAFAHRLGLDPAAVVDVLQSTPLGSPYAVQKARAMLAGDFAPAFALKHAIKDAELAVQAAQASGARLELTNALIPRWHTTADEGHAEEDLAAVYATA
jgi:3-hydroxyisobutyrate dehydrogenase